MAVDIYSRIQQGLDEKRQNLTAFLQTASKTEKEICLCDEGDAVHAHLEVIEESLEKLEDETLGMCVICHEPVDSELLQMDYTATVCLGHFTEEELRNLESELELSQIVQRALLPQRIPDIPGIELAAFHRPSEIIGGDYFDFFQFRDGSHGLVIADVSGHGVSAGILMSSLQTALRTIAFDSDSPAEILARINRFYIHNINFTTFVTVFLARFDPETFTLTYVNAGHNPPAIRHKGNSEISWLMPTAPAIGLMEEFRPTVKSVVLSKGDSLLLYTDGVTEVLDTGNHQFGQERLAEVLRQNGSLTAPAMLQVVRQGVGTFGDHRPLADDVTMIALKVSE